MQHHQRNLYTLLQVSPEARTEIIRYAYRFLANKYHPDNATTGDSTTFRQLTDAWRILCKEETREAYDRSLRESNHYRLLEVSADADVTIIRYAYRHLVAQYHPDNGETGDADMFKKLTVAWKTLADSGTRAEYDQFLKSQE